jgi:DNA-binding MarR family transcriptional regulator
VSDSAADLSSLSEAPAQPGEPAANTEDARKREVTLALSAMIRSIDGYRFRAASDAQVGLTELRAMGHLIEAGPLSPKQLAAALDLTTGTVTALLDRLERSGLVARSAHPRDRRMLQVELTPFGQQKMDGVLAGFHEQVAAAVEGMSADRLDAAIEFVQRVRAEIVSRGADWRRTSDAAAG